MKESSLLLSDYRGLFEFPHNHVHRAHIQNSHCVNTTNIRKCGLVVWGAGCVLSASGVRGVCGETSCICEGSRRGQHHFGKENRLQACAINDNDMSSSVASQVRCCWVSRAMAVMIVSSRPCQMYAHVLVVSGHRPLVTDPALNFLPGPGCVMSVCAAGTRTATSCARPDEVIDRCGPAAAY